MVHAESLQAPLQALADVLGPSVDLPFILWPRAEATENYDGLLAACRAAGFSPQIALHLADAPAILGMVAAGLGVTILAHSYRVLGREGVTFVPLPALTSTLRVVWALDQLTPPVARFLDVVREIAGRDVSAATLAT